jgi:hypothetical protein
MWYHDCMETQRTITMLLPNDDDLRATLAAFRKVQNAVTATAFHDGKPLRAVALQRAVYEQVKGHLSSQVRYPIAKARGLWSHSEQAWT